MLQLKHLLVFSVLLVGANCSGCFNADDKEISGLCYTFVSQKMTFEDARDWCHYKNPVSQSYLAYMQNQFTANFLASYGKTAFGSNDATFWVGLSREKNWMPWTWDTGYKLGQSWSNFDNQISQNYVAERVSNAKWTTFPDNSTNYFVCSYDPNDPPTFTPQTPTKPTSKTTTTTTSIGPTTTADTSCNSKTQPPTFLFAYSNDFDPQTILNTWIYGFLDMETRVSTIFPWFANVRFDTEKIEEIFYDNKYRYASESIRNNLPDPSLGYKNSSVGSNIYKALDPFFTNMWAPVCGSVFTILVKRYPNDQDFSNLLAKLRQHHITVHVITSATPSGGSLPKAAYNLASKTNGLGLFEQDDQFYNIMGRLPLYTSLYPVYSTNIQVSGVGTIDLPQFSSPMGESFYYAMMTYQDHLPLDSFQSVRLGWYNKKDPHSGHFLETIKEAEGAERNGTYTADFFRFEKLVYKMTLDYNYTDSNVENLQVRIYNEHPLNHWLPYSD